MEPSVELEAPSAPTYRRWLLPLTAVALLIGLVLSVQSLVMNRARGREIPFMGTLRSEMPFWFLWSAAIPLVLWSSERIRRRCASRVNVQLILHAAVALAIMLAQSALLYESQLAFGITDYIAPVWQGAIAVTLWRMPTNLLVYGCLIGLMLYDESRRRSAALERRAAERDLAASRLAEQLATARLDALRSQLNPHFLFNALHSVAMLVRRGNGAEAVRALAGLSDLLRHLLAGSTRAQVTLAQEVEFVEKYLTIEQARFGEDLRTELDIAPETLKARVPSLILQPIVENAVRHGAAVAKSGGLVRVVARRNENTLILEVSDNGPGVSDDAAFASTTGIGIRNTLERLSHLYGDRFSFDLKSDGRGAVATLTFPFSDTELAAALR